MNGIQMPSLDSPYIQITPEHYWQALHEAQAN